MSGWHRALAVGALAALFVAAAGLRGAEDPVPAAPAAAVDHRRPGLEAAPRIEAASTRANATARLQAAMAATSLRDTQPDGDWSVGSDGRVQPGLALRRRFDHYLALQGELSPEALRPLLLQQVAEQHGPLAAADIGALWDRYVALQRHAWRTQADPRDPWSIGPALDERVRVRREQLGIAVAEAFYGEEHAALQALLAQVHAGMAPTKVGEDVLPPPQPDAAAREAEVVQAWAAWNARLAAAHEAIGRLRRAPELSAPQRDAAVEAWVEGHFSADERLRARALLGLPPA